MTKQVDVGSQALYRPAPNKYFLADIEKEIDKLGDAAKDYDRIGLKAVAHLGGIGGLGQFVRSNCQYNRQDELGTSQWDYYVKF